MIHIAPPKYRMKRANIMADPPCHGIDPMFGGYNEFYLISGKCGSGKSYLLYNLLTNRDSYGDKFDMVLFVSPTKTLKWSGSNIVFMDTLTNETLRHILNDERLKGLNVAIVFDDMVQPIISLSKKGDALGDMIRNGRHIMSVLTEEIEYETEEGELKKITVPLRRPKGSLTIFMTTQVYNEIPLKHRKLASFVIQFPPADREFDSFARDNLGLLPKSIDVQLFREAIWSKEHDNLMIDLTRHKLYHNFGEITLRR
jgi:hypothetical protein